MARHSTSAVRTRFAGVHDNEPRLKTIPLQDVRLKRELAHRRLVVSMLRRLMRVLTLHALDAALLAGVALLVATVWPAPALRDLIPAFVVVFLLSLNAVGAYSPGEARRDGGRLFTGVLLSTLILLSISIFPPYLPAAWTVLGATSLLAFCTLLVGRKVTDQIVRQAYMHGIGLRRAVVIGNLSEVGQAIQQLRDRRNIDQYIVGHLAPDHEPDPAGLGVLSELPRVLDEFDVQEVVLATSLSPKTVRWLSEACFQRGTQVYVFPSVLGTVECRVEPLYVGACPLMHLAPARLEMPSLFVKRLFDLIVATTALILAAPLILAVALAIRLDSPGPVFFRQQRVGLGGKPFTIWKFRSMYSDSEARKQELIAQNAYSDTRLFKVERDPRITRVGRFLRRSSLDELPQLFNVLSGDMSLVGPRPPLQSEVDHYEAHHFERLTVVPGITGPWQVNGRNLITDFEKVVRMERAYIRSWSLLLDAKILLRTVKVVISGEGAY
jgi:exopolysaccharide biosynthesis polyprenyl glycosylphosphotransferase